MELEAHHRSTGCRLSRAPESCFVPVFTGCVLYDGSDESQTAFTERGVECLQEFVAEVRTWPGGIRAFLQNEGCDAATIDRIIADQPKP